MGDFIVSIMFLMLTLVVGVLTVKLGAWLGLGTDVMLVVAVLTLPLYPIFRKLAAKS
jgi:hypothetical protein